MTPIADQPSRSPAARQTAANGKARRRTGPPDEQMRGAAARALATSLDASLAAYNRASALRCLHRLSPATIDSQTVEAAQAVLRELERALRAERARAGRWSYDLNRHIGLLVAYRAEQARAHRLRMTDDR